MDLKPATLYNIIMAASAAWYLCVLATLVWVGRHFHLFANHSPKGWLMIGAAFLASIAVNFLFNPIFWLIVACFIRAGKEEGAPSKWRAYPPIFGVLIFLGLGITVGLSLRNNSGGNSSSVTIPVLGQPAAPTGRSLVLDGIMFSNDPSALVNGGVVKKGDQLLGFEVIEIKEKSVVFQDEDGKVIELHL
jgi:hypothetical protein